MVTWTVVARYAGPICAGSRLARHEDRRRDSAGRKLAEQKGRVDRHHRAEPRERHPCGGGHRVLLGDADIEEPLRIALPGTANNPVGPGIAAVTPYDPCGSAFCRGNEQRVREGLGVAFIFFFFFFLKKKKKKRGVFLSTPADASTTLSAPRSAEVPRESKCRDRVRWLSSHAAVAPRRLQRVHNPCPCV